MVEINKIHLSAKRLQPQKSKLFWLIPSLLFIILLSAVILVLLARPIIASAQKTYTLVKETYASLKSQDLVATQGKLAETKKSLEATQALYNRLKPLKFVPFVASYWRDGDRFFISAKAELEAGEVLIEAITPYADILGFSGQGSFAGGTAEDRIIKMVQTLSKITPKFDEIGAKLKIADENLAKIDPGRYPEKFRSQPIREQIIKVTELTHDATLALNDAKPILEVLPQALGYPDNKKYLALFQNDGELRATGGFLTAYGILRMESGRVRAERSDDIYSLDKKFNSRIKAPEPIAKYLLSASLKSGIVPYFYLRDMNLSPDFRVSMETFLPNYQTIKDEPKVNGVIAIDTKVLTDLLAIVGPIDVAGYGKFTLEADRRCFDIPQIICELEHLADVPIPGIRVARKDILGPMMQELILKAMGAPKNTWPKLFKTIIDDISQKHIIFYFTDSKIQESAEVFGAAGRLKDYDGDYLHINDSNFGGAKSNLFVKQEVEREIVTQNGKTTATLTITYTNPVAMSDCNLERKTGLCLNGILRDYIRVYVPKGSKLIEGLGSEEKFATKDELGKTYFEGFFTLRGGGGRAKIVLRYELPQDVKTEKLLIQKQPGTIGNHYKVNVGQKMQEFDLVTDKELKANEK